VWIGISYIVPPRELGARRIDPGRPESGPA
jgi:hypothetical protein